MEFQGKLMNQLWENDKKLILGLILAQNFSWVLRLLDIRHCCKLPFMEFHEKLMNQTWENGKKPSFGPNFGSFGPNSSHHIFFQKSGFISH